MLLKISAKLAEKMSAFLASEKFKIIDRYRVTNRFIEATDGFKWMRFTFNFENIRETYLLSNDAFSVDSDEIVINTDEDEAIEIDHQYYPNTEFFVKKLEDLKENGTTLNVSAKHLKEICELIIERSDEEHPMLSMHVNPEKLVIGFSTNYFEMPRVEAVLALIIDKNEVSLNRLKQENIILTDTFDCDKCGKPVTIEDNRCPSCGEYPHPHSPEDDDVTQT